MKPPIPPQLEINFAASLESLTCILETASLRNGKVREKVSEVRAEVLERIGNVFDDAVNRAIAQLNNMDGGKRKEWK